MKTKKQKGIVETLLLLGLTAIVSAGIYFYNKTSKTNNLGAIPNEVAFFEDSLASKITSTQTTLTLVKGTNKTGNIASSTYGFVIDEGSSSEEVVICDCTATACTNCKRGISDVDGQTETTALKFEHRRGAVVKMTDHPSLVRLIRSVNGTDAIDGTLYYKTAVSSPSSTAIIDRAWLDTTSTANFVYLTGDQTIAGEKTFSNTTTFSVPVVASSVPTDNSHLANKLYVDSVAIAGAPSSSESVYGISKLSVAPVNANFPIALGQNDPVINKDYIYSSFTAGEEIASNDAIAVAHRDNCIIYNTTTEQLTAETATTANLWYYQSFTAPAGSPKFYGFSMIADNVGGATASFNAYLNSTATTTNALFSCPVSVNTGAVKSIGNVFGCSTSTGITLTGGNTYYLILSNNYYMRTYVTTTNAYSGGVFATSTDGITWQTEANKDALFQVYYLTGTDNYAYKAGTSKFVSASSTVLGRYVLKADKDCRYNFVGFASSSASTGASVNVRTAGLMTGFSGLDTSSISRTKYYTQTATSTESNLGLIVNSASAYADYEVGYAMNSSTILINNLDHE